MEWCPRMMHLLVCFILFFFLLVSFSFSFFSYKLEMVSFNWFFYFWLGFLDIPAQVSFCIAYRKKEIEGEICKWVWEILATIAVSSCFGCFIHLKTLISTGATGNSSFTVAKGQKDTPLILPLLSLLVLVVRFSYHFLAFLHLSISAASNIQPYLMLFYLLLYFPD